MMLIEIATAVAARTPTPVAPGWSPTTTMAVVQWFTTILLGGGGIYTLSRGISVVWKAWNESKKQDNDAAAAVRREMAEITERQQKRIDALEIGSREDRKRFDEEVANVRKAHVEEVAEMRIRYEAEIRSLREEIAGYHRQLVQFQRTSGMAMQVGGTAPTTAMRRVEESGLGDILRNMDVPEGPANAGNG